ncbi:MAG TPA: HAD-IIIC family phosphatase [Candidatus Binataceae bacterium]|nr:HAD-IIIC family phosphatase [Candidatus Binataceae bacterium]
MVAATFTAEPLLPYLELVLKEAGLAFAIRCAPYGQVFQELLSPNSAMATNTDGVGIVLVRLEDFVRDIQDSREARRHLAKTADELADALAQYSRRTAIPTVLATLPPSPDLAEPLYRASVEASSALAEKIAGCPGISLLSIEKLAEDSYDALADRLGHVPFSEEQYAAIALALARRVHALRLSPYKVLALDCDQTLWSGVVAEDGVQGLSVSPGRACLQRFAVEKQAQGVLICLVSKNAESDVLDVFRQRSDMILQTSHIVAHRINWESKPRNLAALAEALNLGLDAFVFIDDNPIECAEVRATLPEVLTLQLPHDDGIEEFLRNLWAFDKLTVTEEDLRRTRMYRENAARRELEESSADMLAFIASLDLKIDVAPPCADEWERVAQLTVRTNQFNFTTRRYREDEVRRRASQGDTVLRVQVRDRFGDYGIVGVIIAHEFLGALVVDTFLLSCRVLGRGVEHAMLRKLGELASQKGLCRIDLPYIATAKNEPARVFLESVAAEFRCTRRDRCFYALPTERACEVAFRPDRAPVLKGKPTEGKPVGAHNGAVGIPRWQRYEKLARVLTTGEAVLELSERVQPRARISPRPPVPPANDTERRLLALWEDLLHVKGLGVEDNYFEIGGNSLLSVRLIAEISRRFGAMLPLTMVLEAPTVRELALRIDHPRPQRTETLVELKRGGSRNLFLIHDGDGETLLYMNLARRMPQEVSVIGVLPPERPGVPLAHTTIADMAAFYLGQIQKKQPEGPYFLGGMCAGGVIAYEIAARLVSSGQAVGLVALLDAARPGARKQSWRHQRIARLRRAIITEQDGSKSAKTLAVIRVLAQKAANSIRWEIIQRAEALSARIRFYLLAKRLKDNRPWPGWMPGLTVRQIYNLAELNYTPATLTSSSVLLARATRGEADDTPFREIYTDEALGWETVAPSIRVVDVAGGHSSMLHEEYVDSLASAIIPYLRETDR